MVSVLVLGLAISAILAAFAWTKKRSRQAIEEAVALRRAAERASA